MKACCVDSFTGRGKCRQQSGTAPAVPAWNAAWISVIQSSVSVASALACHAAALDGIS